MAELDHEIAGFPSDALREEPYYYVIAIHFLSALSASFEALQKLDLEVQEVDPYYVPFYVDYTVWLCQHRPADPSLPRPEVWLTNRFKLDVLDSEEIQQRKCRAYAQIIAFHGDKNKQFTPGLLDWPTLKTGLQDLIRHYGPQTDWPTRYLASAFAFHDQTAANEALAIIQGNYSQEVINDPHTFQVISRWANPR